MKTIGNLLRRDLDRKIEEIIQVNQDDEQSVYSEITEYIATDSIRDQYQKLLGAMASAPADPDESIGVWVSGFFGSGKSSFAKYLGLALQNRSFNGKKFADLFKDRLEDQRISIRTRLCVMGSRYRWDPRCVARLGHLADHDRCGINVPRTGWHSARGPDGPRQELQARELTGFDL